MRGFGLVGSWTKELKLIVILLLSGLCLTSHAALQSEEFKAATVSFKIANHSSSALQVKLFHNGMHYRDLYMAPYYASDLSQSPEGLYTLEIYDTADNFMGYIEETKALNAYDNGTGLISISRFNLKPEVSTRLSYPDIEELAKRIDLQKMLASQPKTPDAPKPVSESPPVLPVARRLKLSNITNYFLYMELLTPKSEIIDSRFLSVDAYIPEIISKDSQALLLSPETRIRLRAFAPSTKAPEAQSCLETGSCALVLKNFEIALSELRVDETGSYIWVIDELP